MRYRILVALGLTLAAVSISGAQEGSQPPVIISVETNLVTLPVTVVDRHGRFVAGLSREQFSVYDNGELQSIEFFTHEDTPATIGLVLDRSSSMRGRRDDVTAAATAFASLSHPLDELFTVNFNETVWPGLPRHVPFAESVDQLRAALAAAPAQGMTAMYDAIDRSLDHLGYGTRDRKVLIVVSDGGDNASTQALAAVLEHARRTGAVIHSVILASPGDPDAKPDVLKRLSKETGGTSFAPRRVADVMEAFNRIAAEIRSGYTIGFSPVEAGDDGFRPIRVTATGNDGRALIVRTKAGYYAGRSSSVLR